MALIMRPHITTLFLLLILLLVLPIPGTCHVRQPSSVAHASIHRKLLHSKDSSHHHHHHHSHPSSYHGHSTTTLVAAAHEPNPTLARDDTGNEIDPRYGVEKRFVPSGPNPLHH
ncbi:inactive protein FON2 SPARE1-like [Phalaenopsis equestris]|uniref:inactive protein FON2 SPARE1-like n=1 Tax=Phalaenopsis equestris TaxID=78828 RepID=UPI0009E40BB6|nr:inactive protein FON2 SPARE1-like [Phalaenopsis equestris]